MRLPPSSKLLSLEISSLRRFWINAAEAHRRNDEACTSLQAEGVWRPSAEGNTRIRKPRPAFNLI